MALASSARTWGWAFTVLAKACRKRVTHVRKNTREYPAHLSLPQLPARSYDYPLLQPPAAHAVRNWEPLQQLPQQQLPRAGVFPHLLDDRREHDLVLAAGGVHGRYLDKRWR